MSIETDSALTALSTSAGLTNPGTFQTEERKCLKSARALLQAMTGQLKEHHQEENRELTQVWGTSRTLMTHRLLWNQPMSREPTLTKEPSPQGNEHSRWMCVLG